MPKSGAAGRGGKKRVRDEDQVLPSKARKTKAKVYGGWKSCTMKDLLCLVAEGFL